MGETRDERDAEGESRIEAGARRYLTSALLEREGLPHLFTTRHFPGVAAWRDPGVPFQPSALALLADLGVGAEPPAYVRQVHGADVIAATRGGLAGPADVVATSRPGLPVAIFTADCLPIVVYDAANGRLAMAHAGWRGTARSAARAAADALAALGGDPRGFAAAIGPSIGPCCYEVDTPVIDRFDASFPDRWPAWVRATGPGKWMLDLWRANADQLEMAGLDPARIDNPRLCTACRADLFFSYRRGRGQGRLAAVASLPLRAAERPGPAAGSR
jgi:YfiH family protein